METDRMRVNQGEGDTHTEETHTHARTRIQGSTGSFILAHKQITAVAQNLPDTEVMSSVFSRVMMTMLRSQVYSPP